MTWIIELLLEGRYPFTNKAMGKNMMEGKLEPYPFWYGGIVGQRKEREGEQEG